MSDAEIEQAIRDAEQYAEQDKLRRDAMEVQNEGALTLNKAETAVKKAWKKLDKAEKKQIRSDCAELRKLLSKAKPEKMTATDLDNIRNAISRVESSSANARRLAETAAPEDAEPEDSHQKNEH
jgi:molecular chaperone DnaK